MSNTPKEIWIDLFSYLDKIWLTEKRLETDAKYLSESYHNEVVNDLQTKLNYFQDHADIFKASSDKFEQENEQLKPEIERLKRNEEAYKNRIRILEKFIPKSDNNVTLD